MKLLKLVVGIVMVVSLLTGTAVAQGPFICGQHKVQSMKHRISKKQAKNIALTRYPGKIVGKVNQIYVGNGKFLYTIHVKWHRVTHQLAINADSGRIEGDQVIATAPIKIVRKPAKHKVIRSWHPPKVHHPKKLKIKAHPRKPKSHKKGHGSWVR